MHFYLDINLVMDLIIIVFILFFVRKNIKQLIEMKGLPLKYDEVRPLVQSSEKTLGGCFMHIVNADEKNSFEILYGFKGFYINCPFLFKIHLHQDYIILTFLGKYAEIFKKSECEMKKRGFYTFLECVKNDKRYCINTFGYRKQIEKWINK